MLVIKKLLVSIVNLLEKITTLQTSAYGNSFVHDLNFEDFLKNIRQQYFSFPIEQTTINILKNLRRE